jgi:hypothetical protein
VADPEIAMLARNARRDRNIPHGAVCDGCQTTIHLKLRDGRILCYACRRAKVGAGPTERDHIAGRINLGGLVADLRLNPHRTVTELRNRMGTEEWPPADGDPLLTLAHVLAGIASLLFLFADWLIALAADARARLGADVWEGAPLAPIVP